MLKYNVYTFREITEHTWKTSRMFRAGEKKSPVLSVCCTFPGFRDVLRFSCVANSSKYPLANHSWNYQTCISNTKNSGGNHCNWGLGMAQKKKKSVLENTLLLQSSARTAGIRESCDQCYSDMQLDNSSSFGLIKENYMKQHRFHRQLYPTQKL